jgi:hypothetical protein
MPLSPVPLPALGTALGTGEARRLIHGGSKSGRFEGVYSRPLFLVGRRAFWGLFGPFGLDNDRPVVFDAFMAGVFRTVKVRLPEEMFERMEEARGRIGRMPWLRDAIEMYLASPESGSAHRPTYRSDGGGHELAGEETPRGA